MKSVIPYTPDEVLVFVTRGFAKVHKITISEAEGFFAKYGVDKAILDHPELYAHSGPDGWDYWISNRVSSQNGVNYPRPESYYDN